MQQTPEIALKYDALARVHGRSFRTSRYRTEKSFLQRQMSLLRLCRGLKGKRILDVGCGTGIFSGPLSGRNTLVGADISAESLKLAQATHRGVLAQAFPLPFQRESFDTVLMLEILQHLEDPGPFFREVGRVLKPGGFVILSSIHKRSLLHSVLRPLGGYEDLRFHALSDMRRALAGEGLTAEEIRFLAYPLPMAWSGKRETVVSRLATAWMLRAVKNAGGGIA